VTDAYYSDEMVTIYHGRCEDIVPELGRFDLLLTDPPYGIGEGDADRNKRPHSVPAGPKNTAGTLVVQRDYAKTAWRDVLVDWTVIEAAVASSDRAIVWGGNYYPLPPSRGWIVWDKRNEGSDQSDCELAWTNLDRAVRVFRHMWNGMLKEFRGKDEEHRSHPTQKPTALMSFCLQYAKAEPGWRVLDPFMGSGTTLVACRKAGIRSVGIDAEEKYCEIAVQRVAQRSLFENSL
jgi:DNA modification methylase